MFVKVRETYDLHTIKNKMSIIGIHTPKSNIIKANYPGLLMQCKAYRPVAADVRLACASMMPLDPLGVGTSEGDVAPEDVFNPILYKAMSNFGMSNLDAFINANQLTTTSPSTVDYDNDLSFSENGVAIDQFDMYYGLLSQTHEWKHANPQQGLSMSGLKPLVFENYQVVGDNRANSSIGLTPVAEGETGAVVSGSALQFRGNAHPMPMLNCTAMTYTNDPSNPSVAYPDTAQAGFGGTAVINSQVGVPDPKVFVGCIIVPPSRLHQLFYRLVVEWTLEFSKIRPLADLMSWSALANLGDTTHYISYSYEASKLVENTGMVDTTEGSDIQKVM